MIFLFNPVFWIGFFNLFGSIDIAMGLVVICFIQMLFNFYLLKAFVDLKAKV